MKIAIIMYDRMSLASFAEAYDFFAKLDGVSVQACAFKQDIRDEYGLSIQPSVHGESLYGADVLVVPSGLGALGLRHDDIFLSWIRSASSARLKLGLDLGSLILGGAGFLDDKTAVIRGGYKNALSEYCEVVEDSTFIQNGDIISATSFTLGLREFLSGFAELGFKE